MSRAIEKYREVNKEIDARIPLEGNTWINDIQLYIPPENIDVIKSANTDRVMTLRSNTSFKMQDGYSDVAITMTIPFPSGQGLVADKFPLWNYKLRPLIAQIKQVPLIIVQNEFIVAQFDKKYTNQYGTIPLVVENMTVATVENLPDTVSLVLTCSYANLKPYMSDLLFRVPTYLTTPEQSFRAKGNVNLTPYPINSMAFGEFYQRSIGLLNVMESYNDKVEFSYKKYYVTNALTFNVGIDTATFSYKTTEKYASYTANQLFMKSTPGTVITLNVDFKEKLDKAVSKYKKIYFREVVDRFSQDGLIDIYAADGRITSKNIPSTYEDDINALIERSYTIQKKDSTQDGSVFPLSEAHLSGQAIVLSFNYGSNFIQILRDEGFGVTQITETLYDVWDPLFVRPVYENSPESNTSAVTSKVNSSKFMATNDGKIVIKPNVISDLKTKIEKEMLPDGVKLDPLSFDDKLSYGNKVVFYEEFKIPLSYGYSIPTHSTVTFISNITKIRMNHYDYPTVQFMGGNDPIGSLVFMCVDTIGQNDLKLLQNMYDTVKENSRLVKGKAKISGVTINTPFLTDLVGITNILLENFQVSTLPQSPDARLVEMTFTDTTSNASFKETTLKSFNYTPTGESTLYSDLIRTFFIELSANDGKIIKDIYRKAGIQNLYTYKAIESPAIKAFFKPVWDPKGNLASVIGTKGGERLSPEDKTISIEDLVVEMCRLFNDETIHSTQYTGQTFIKDDNGNLMNFDNLLHILPFVYRILYMMQLDIWSDAPPLLTFKHKDMIRWAALAICIIKSKESSCSHFSSTNKVILNGSKFKNADDVGIGQLTSDSFLTMEDAKLRKLSDDGTSEGRAGRRYLSSLRSLRSNESADFEGLSHLRVDTSVWGKLYFGLTEQDLINTRDAVGSDKTNTWKEVNSTLDMDLTGTNNEFINNGFLTSGTALQDALAIVFAIRSRNSSKFAEEVKKNQTYKRGNWVPFYPLKRYELIYESTPSVVLDPMDPIQSLIAAILHFFLGTPLSKIYSDRAFGESSINKGTFSDSLDVDKMKSTLTDMAVLYNQGTLEIKTLNKVRQEGAAAYRKDFVDLLEIAQLALGNNLEALDKVFTNKSIKDTAVEQKVFPNVNLNDEVSRLQAISSATKNEFALRPATISDIREAEELEGETFAGTEASKITKDSSFPIITEEYGFLYHVEKYLDPFCTDRLIEPKLHDKVKRAIEESQSLAADKSNVVVQTPTTYELNYNNALRRLGELILSYAIKTVINDETYTTDTGSEVFKLYTEALINGLKNRRLSGICYPDLLREDQSDIEPDFYFTDIDFRKEEVKERERSLKTYVNQLYNSIYAGVNQNTKVDLVTKAGAEISNNKFLSFEFAAENLDKKSDENSASNDDKYRVNLKTDNEEKLSGLELDSTSTVDSKRHLFIGTENPTGKQEVPIYAADKGDAVIGNLTYNEDGSIESRGLKLPSMGFGAGKTHGLNYVNATNVEYTEAPFAGMNYTRASQSQGKDGRYLNDYIKQMKRDYRVARRMYPTFKLYILEENTIESNWLAYDDFYSINTVQEIRIVRQKDNPADLCYISIADLFGTFTSQKFSSESARVLEAEEFRRREELNTAFANPINNLMLKDGMCMQVRMGYSNDPNNLEVIFNGKIVSVENESSIVNILCQSYGTELIQTVKSNSDVDFFDRIGSFDTDELLTMMITQPEVKHFGRWRLSDPIRTQLSNIRADGKPRSSWTLFPKPNDINICPPTQMDWGYITNNINPRNAIMSALGFNYYYNFNMDGMTPWDVFRESMLRHPGYITYPVPYETRMTMYFGHPNGMYIYRDKSPVAFALSKDSDNFNTFAKRVGERLVKTNDSRVRGTDGEEFMSNLLNNIGCSKFFQNHWVASSHLNIVNNQIKADSRDVYNKIFVKKTEKDDFNKEFLDFYRSDHEIELSPFLLDNEIRQTTYTNRNIATDLHAIRYGTALLQQECQKLYKGDITILGEPGIKPYDIVYIYDTTNQMFGFIEVNEVIHTMSRDFGFVTTIKPHMVTNTNENVNSPTSSAMMAFAFGWLTDSFKSDVVREYRSATIATEVAVGITAAAAAIYAGPFMAFLAVVSGVAGVFGLDTKIMSWGIEKYPIILSPLMKNGVPYIFGVDSFNTNKTITESLRFEWNKFKADFGLAVDVIQDNINALTNNQYPTTIRTSR